MSDLLERLKRVTLIVSDVDGVLTDGRMWFDGEGRPFRYLHARDGAALTLWRLSGGKSALVSGLGSKALEAIKHQWQCVECHMWIRDKGRVCREMAERQQVSLEAMAFVGDDLVDLSAMQTVGLAVAVADAAPEVINAAHLVLDTPGGKGAIRELVYRLLRARGALDEMVALYCNRKDHTL